MAYYGNFKKQNIINLLSIISNALLFLFLITGLSQSIYSQTPVAANGKLSVSNGQLVNNENNPVQLRGMSTHGLQWYSTCINFDAISALTSSWGADVLRLAMYIEEDGYVTDPEYYKTFINELVDLTEQFGIYCIIDWHVHNPGDPWANIDDAREFWSYMSAKHAGKEHVLYEICNEPNGVEWSSVKSYAEDIIPIIRSNDLNTVILVGTPNWSQDVDIASLNPLNYDNILYSLHFYSGTHGQSLRDKANTAMANGIGIFVTEWGTSQSTGDGGPFLSPESDDWINWMNDNKISWCNWSYADKDEVSAALASGSCFGGEWNNTSTSGEYVKNNILNPSDAWEGNENIPPVGLITKPEAGAKFELYDTINISATALDQDGSVTLVEFYANGSKIGEDATEPYSVEWVAGTLGQVELSLVIIDDESETNISSSVFIDILEEIVQYAYPDGTPHPIEGTIAGINFDIGGEGVAYHDEDATNKGGASRTDEGVDTEGSDGGNIGYIVNGEWLEYTVDVNSAGSYQMEIRTASEPGGGKFHLEIDGEDISGAVDVPSTGSWTNYQTITVDDITFAAGEQILRIVIDIGDFNYSTMTFSYTGTAIEPTGITLSSSNLEIERGTTHLLTAEVLPDDATNKNVSWISSDESIVSVNSNGTITAIAEGTASITATTIVRGFSDTCTVTVLPGNTFALTTSTTGSGTVTQDPEADFYEPGTEVTLTAVANAGYVFDSWSGDTSGTDEVITVTMDEDKNITAQFIPDAGGCEEDTPISLSYTFEGAGEYCWITSGDIEYVNSWALDLLEINGIDLTNTWSNQFPAKVDGYYYIHLISSVSWGHLDIEGSESDENQTLSLTTAVSGEGTVSVDPVSEIYEEGTVISVTAIPDDGYYLDSWSGDASGSLTNISVVMDGNKSVQANFLPISGTRSFNLSLSIVGSGTVSPESGEYDESAVITLVAMPDSGFEFVEWSGDITGTSDTIDVTMSSDISVIATFRESTENICENPLAITVPYTQTGIGMYCWITSDDIASINSWNMEVVEINGVDFTNEWSDSLPDKIDGSYYISYQGLYSHSHMEITSVKSTEVIDGLSLTTAVVYPNPFSFSTVLTFENPELVNKVLLIDNLGKTIKVFSKTEILDNMVLGANLPIGMYFLKVICKTNEYTLIITKQ
jgi:uncharacterized repeat protein (TIGR02543 family)